MKTIFYFVSFSVLLVLFSCKVAKKETIETRNIDPKQTNKISDKLTFPDDWLGYWKGDLNIYGSSGLKQTIPMALDNSITETEGVYTWAIIYGQDTVKGRRDYVLKEYDKDKGHYIVDEQNGILLDAYLIDNELVSIFDVMDNTLISTYKIEGDKMIFEIMMNKSAATNTTGDTIIGTDTIPPVNSYRPTVRQKARLSKVRG